ncbi:uncharacterized protein EI90DRAFT_3294529 [Cantharellus anzutake]|uniref:uncharacterized protein n=1 Tax=Cantharellus anzutake TaxID=1750568 RepID=UPI0019039C1B|nr:uncharacterized protein EI90DRAFT_3294529 [Cantharellus anzutake]KAF8313288.1 hypothetical protein EI90DRAFT_3294529 [Cantharellus anzutake]
MASKVLWAAVAIYIVYRASWFFLRRSYIKSKMILSDIELLANSYPPPIGTISGTAVVAGGSLSGYISARVLANYFEAVVIIEPEIAISLRGRVSQRAHFHSIGPICLPILRELFSNFDKEAPKDDVYILSGFRRWWAGPSYFGDLDVHRPDQISASRLSLESLCRRLAIAYCGEKLQVIQGTVTSVESSTDNATISSVSYRPASVTSTTTIPCALFVDCSGSASIGSKLLPLASKKWGPYERISYNPNVRYYSTSIKLLPETQRKVARMLPKNHVDFGRWDTCGVLGAFTPTSATGRSLWGYSRINGDELLIGYSGWGIDTCPETFAEYIELTRQLYSNVFSKDEYIRDEWFFRIIQVASEDANILDEPIKWDNFNLVKSGRTWNLTDVDLDAQNSCFWNDYASKPVPNNFIAVGDALMCVNPVFGQGVIKVLTNSVILNTILHNALKPPMTKPQLPSHLSQSYFKRALTIDRRMFDTNRMLDYGYDTTIPQAGETLEFGAGFRNHWMTLMNFLPHDGKSFETFRAVLGGYRPGLDLMTPSLLLKAYFWMWWSPPKLAQG